VTFKDLHRAICDIREVAGKYYALLTLRIVVRWEPAVQYDTITPFTMPWVTDRNAVEIAVRKEAEAEESDA
jgi:hypothetical protein